MIFLKHFQAHGFKSFAERTDVSFSNNVSGVVGPNGSGKSNIVDAIKWVLGEKSNKTLRGKTSDDIIFYGSKGHEQSKTAEVTLTFSNENKVLHFDGDEVSITRRLTRGSGNNEYFINGNECRLKDIQEMFLDTGLSKGSLGIISQNTVQWFVEAKPEDRRTIFEEAAGIGLYTRKKEESASQLARTTENLEQINVIVHELKKDIEKLEKQAEKAKSFSDMKKQLTTLDLTILVKDLNYYNEKEKQLADDIKIAKNELENFEPEIKQLIDSLSNGKEKLTRADHNIEILNKEFAEVIEEINKIEIKKSLIDSKVFADLSSENTEKKIEAYRTLITTCRFEIRNATENIQKFKDEILGYTEIVNALQAKRSNLSEISSKKSIRSAEIRMHIKNISETLLSNNSSDLGPRTVMENSTALTGICGLVKQHLIVSDEYEKAITTCLGKATQSVIVETTDDAENAVDFLKRNRSGRATFLPLSRIKPRQVRTEHIEVIRDIHGFVGIASDLISSEKKYQVIFDSLLGNTIISTDLPSANNISRATLQMYRIVTLDGDMIMPGGAITGGFNRNRGSDGINLEQKLEQLKNEHNQIADEFMSLKTDLEKVIIELNEASNKQNEKRILLSKYEDLKRTNENQMTKYEVEYQQLAETPIDGTIDDLSADVLNEKLAKLNLKKDKLNEELNVDRQTKVALRSQIDDQEAKVNDLRERISTYRENVSSAENNKIRCDNFLENAKTKINTTYKMTVEFAMENYNQELPISDQQARDTITRLQNEIDRLGNINMDAINELEEKQKRHDEMYIQQVELETAKTNILKVIEELDLKARGDFDKTIQSVNENLPIIFKYLFGGGSCRLEYTNPEDILSSGIEVMANPPGKNIVHLNLLSGGEKTLVALSILFAILKYKTFPLIVLDEAESALDPANVERFGNIIRETAKQTQFVVITHRPGTMERCDVLYGATMQTKGVTGLYKVSIETAKKDFIEAE